MPLPEFVDTSAFDAAHQNGCKFTLPVKLLANNLLYNFYSSIRQNNLILNRKDRYQRITISIQPFIRHPKREKSL